MMIEGTAKTSPKFKRDTGEDRMIMERYSKNQSRV
jgi:hypothetical protein